MEFKIQSGWGRGVLNAILILSPHLSPSSFCLFVTTSCFSSHSSLLNPTFSSFNIYNLGTLLFLTLPCTPKHPTPPSHPPSLSSDRGAQRRKACLDFKRLPVYLSPPHLNCQGGTALEINSFLPPLGFYPPSPLLTTVCVWFLLSPTIDLPFFHPPSSSVPVCISFSAHFLCLCPPQHLNVMWYCLCGGCISVCEIETIIFYSN